MCIVVNTRYIFTKIEGLERFQTTEITSKITQGRRFWQTAIDKPHVIFSASCNIYISRVCYDVSVRLSIRLSVTEVHWRILANLGFKFRSQFTAHCGRGACGREGRDHRRWGKGGKVTSAGPMLYLCMNNMPKVVFTSRLNWTAGEVR